MPSEIIIQKCKYCINSYKQNLTEKKNSLRLLRLRAGNLVLGGPHWEAARKERGRQWRDCWQRDRNGGRADSQAAQTCAVLRQVHAACCSTCVAG